MAVSDCIPQDRQLQYSAMPANSHFTPQLFVFLQRLRRNNRREWFLKHKAEYEQAVRDPCLRFIAGFAKPLYEISPHLLADARPARGSLFRIYRDTRFATDKHPYKTHAGMHFSHPGKDVHAPGFYLHLEPGTCFAAAGLWHPEATTLVKVRTAIVSRPNEWRAIRRKIDIEGDSLSRPPRGFPADHEFVEDLKRKDFLASVDFSEEQVCSPTFMADFTAACRKMVPLASFLSSALGLKF